jgi:DNA helicase-2/ATP-dependent DNA helicase PcrA
MTLHCAKGLEFPIVFLTGMENGLLPHSRSSLTEEELEEERRLCYVGMTRACKSLYLSRAETRTIYGERQFTEPSPYLAQIPSELISVEGSEDPDDFLADDDSREFTASPHPRNRFTRSSRLKSPHFPQAAQRGVTEDPESESPPFEIPDLPRTSSAKRASAFSVGDRVEHETLGRGIVRKVALEAGKEKIVVEFHGGRIRKLMAQMAPIRKID